jgi:hypothetical protein
MLIFEANQNYLFFIFVGTNKAKGYTIIIANYLGKVKPKNKRLIKPLIFI